MSEKSKDVHRDIFITPYAKAWQQYLNSVEYLASFTEMKKHGMTEKYIRNILQLAFTEGYNSKED